MVSFTRSFFYRLMLSDEDSVRCSLGDCFIYMDKDAAEEKLQSTTEENEADVKRIESEISDLRDQLKVSLRSNESREEGHDDHFVLNQ